MKCWLRVALGAAWMGTCAAGCGTPDALEASVPFILDDGRSEQVSGSDGRHYRLRRDPQGVPRKLSIDDTTAVTSESGPADAAALAQAFLFKNSRAFRLRADLGDLRLAGVSKRTLDFVQLIQDRPLFGADIRVELEAQARIALVWNRYVPGPEPVVGSTIERQAAVSVSGLDASTANAELGWALEQSGRAVAVWRIDDGLSQVLVDATGGWVRGRDDERREVIGHGRVYRENAFVDARTEETALPDLEEAGILRGPHVSVVAPAGTAVLGRGSHFVFDFAPGSPGFGQVMVYHHVDGLVRWLGSLGFTPRYRPISVHTLAFRELNSYFDPRADAIFLGATAEFDTADDADVVVHEFGHALVQAYAPGLLGRIYAADDAAIHEGFADYVSCAYFDNPLSSESLHLALFREGRADGYLDAIGFDPKQPGRRCNSDRRWQKGDNDDPHVSGMVVSAALWDLRVALAQRDGAQEGKRRADALAISALSHLGRSSNDLADLLEAVLEADRRSGGSAAALIRTAFAAHGIDTSAPVDLRRGPPYVP